VAVASGWSIQMGTAIRRRVLWEDYDAKGIKPTRKTKLEDFAKEFAEKYHHD